MTNSVVVLKLTYYSAYKKVIHIQLAIVLMSIDLNTFMWSFPCSKVINEPKKKQYVSILDQKEKYSIFMTNSVVVLKLTYYSAYKKVIHIQLAIVLTSIDLNTLMWHISKEHLILFPLVPFVHLLYVTHDWVHCHWRWQCHFPVFASFGNLIKAPLPNNATVRLLRLFHLMPCDHILSGNLNNMVLATSPSDLQDISCIIEMNWWIFGQLSGYGETGYSGHAPPLSDLRWNQRWKCWSRGSMKGRGQNKFLPIITKSNLDNLQWLPKLLNAISVCHVWSELAMRSIHCSLPSQLPKLAKSGTWHRNFQWQCTQSCVTYMMTEGYQLKKDELLFTYIKPHSNISNQLKFRTIGPWIWITFCIRTVKV